MEPAALQQNFFNAVKNTLPAHISLVDTVAEVLNISYDSVYRRMRGEKPVTMNELKILCDAFHLSLDQIMQLESEAVVFHAPGINNGELEFLDYIKGILDQLKLFNSFERKQMYYLCKDLPFWHFYTFPEIGAFKTFCWIKTITNHPDYQTRIFSLSEFPFNDCNKIGQQIISEYNKIPSVELWNLESLNSSLLQLKYYRDAGLFKNEEDFVSVLNSLNKMLDHFQNQAETGTKFLPNSNGKANNGNLQFYVNEVILGNNTIIVELDNIKHTYINYNVLYYLITRDPRFTKRTYDSFQTLVTKSTLISGTSEKYRNKFFRDLRAKVEELR